MSGNADSAVPVTLTQYWIELLKKWGVLKNTRQYRPFKVDRKVAGYIDNYNRFLFVNIIGTGHMVPQWK